MKIVPTMTCQQHNVDHIAECIASLDSQSYIVSVPEEVELPPVIKRNSEIVVHIQDKYGDLGALVSFTKTYNQDDDVYCLYVNSSCTYPKHLITEYTTAVPELDRTLKEKLPQLSGNVYGMAGLVMVEDKKHNLEAEFENLLNGEDSDYEKKTMLGYVRENATIDYLEGYGSILIHRSHLHDDFEVYLAKVYSPDLCTDVILSNYLASKKISRTQICNIFINRFMMDRLGCFNNVIFPENKREQYLKTIKYLRDLDYFRVYA